VTLAKEPISFFSPVVHAMAKNGPFTKAINRQYKFNYFNDQFVFFFKDFKLRLKFSDRIQAQTEAGIYLHARKSLTVSDSSYLM
jgi:hypothetical protein